jgi:type IV/VI secretion system ImpK/VasF family protein
MTDDPNRPPRSQGTVFRPSPLQARDGGAAIRPPPIMPPPGLIAREIDDEVPAPATPRRTRSQLMADAMPFIALISRVRLGEGIDSLDDLHDRAMGRLQQFSAGLERRGADAALVRNATYALAATMDDVVQNMPGRTGSDWARRSMVVTTFGEAIGGDRFWGLLDDMLKRPADNIELIELFHACIAAGFEGRYRVASDGDRRRGEAMSAAFSSLPHVRTAAADLSPAWRGAPTPMRKFGYWPVIVAAVAVAALLCFLVWLPLRLMLGEASLPARESLRTLIPEAKVSIAGEAPAAELLQSDRVAELRAGLAGPIGQRQVAVEDRPDGIHIRILAPAMFRSGSDEIEASHMALLGDIATAIDSLALPAGEVRIEGHTDIDPPRSIEYNNDELSQARAEAALGVLRGKLKTPPKVLRAVGKGDRFPVRSAADKEQNRRIEVVVPRSG